MSRRGFFELVIAFLSALATLALAVPFLGSLIGPAFRKKKSHFARVAALDSLPEGVPVEVKYSDLVEDAFVTKMTMNMVWVVKRSPSDVTAYSPVCPHLGCAFNWDQESRHFVCPCHGSVFAIDGGVVGGPAPRPLDTLPIKIEGGELYVEFLRFKSGVPTKIAV